jgi:hypothetical protein
VRRGDPVLELHGPDAAHLAAARLLAQQAVTLNGPIDQTPLVRARVTADGAIVAP